MMGWSAIRFGEVHRLAHPLTGGKMNVLYRPEPISTKQIYNLDEIPIPEGFDAYNFRIPEPGDIYLSIPDALCGGKTFSRCGEINVNGPRIILKKKINQTVEGVYGCEPRVPEGFLMQGFGPVHKGQWFINSVTLKPDLCTETGGWRILLYKLPEPPKKFRVIRVLEYTGSESFIDTTLSRSAVTSEGRVVKHNGVYVPFSIGGGNNVRELSVMKEEIK